jgi:hypothetical protein
MYCNVGTRWLDGQRAEGAEIAANNLPVDALPLLETLSLGSHFHATLPSSEKKHHRRAISLNAL